MMDTFELENLEELEEALNEETAADLAVFADMIGMK